MKKIVLKAGIFLLLGSSLCMQSCIGSFTLTNKVIKWNNQVGSKFINELVFFAFWILPVYEVTAVADLLVINSIEFWSGNNPLEAYTKTVETEHGKYFIAFDGKDYSITCPGGEIVNLIYDNEEMTWSAGSIDGETFPFMTMIDASHVKMITPGGGFKTVELNEYGVMAYSECLQESTGLKEIQI